MDALLLPYSVGALLYCPAASKAIADSVMQERFGKKYSLALCLEDTIDDACVEEAENILIQTLDRLQHRKGETEFYLPKIFIRVRNPGQITRLFEQAGEAARLITGIIAPKFTPGSGVRYIDKIKEVNSGFPGVVYLMPILENPDMFQLQNRYRMLYDIKTQLDAISELVLNVRVGGNDLCHAYGFRRRSTETIHDIAPVAHVLSDIMTVFGTSYIISGAVWEYYNGFSWDKGLEQELSKDRLNGFVGKTVIHPKQIPFVNEAYKVTKADYEDAKAILNWNAGSPLLVAGSTDSARMNEHKTHSNWARKTLALSQAYGIKPDSFPE